MFSPKSFMKRSKKNQLNSESKTGPSHIYESDESVRRALLEILIYIVFLVVTTIVANASHHLYMYYFNQTIERSFLDRSFQTRFDSEVSFNEIVTAADYWNFLETKFLDELHGVISNSDAHFDISINKQDLRDNKGNQTEQENKGEKEPETSGRISNFKKDEMKLQEAVRLIIGQVKETRVNEIGKKYKKETNTYNNINDEDDADDADDADAANDSNDIDDEDETETDKEPELFDSDIKNKLKEIDKLKHLYLRDNILLGPPRLRQIRVKESSCHVHDVFVTYFKSCYAGYSKRVENRTKIYKNTPFFSMSKLRVNRIRGEITSYYGAGYVKSLTFNRRQNENILRSLKEDEWIDRGTRLVVLEFVLFNINTFIFDNVKIIAEILPVGGIIPSHQFQALKLNSIWTERHLGLYIAAGIFYAMTVFYTISEVLQCLRSGLKKYFASVWNILDIIVLILAYLSLAYTIVHPLYLSRLMKTVETDPNTFVSIDYICYWNLLFIDMMGICVFLVWIKIFKYISFNKTMLQFSTTLKKCAKDLFGFAVMFFIVFLAYAQLGLLIFGTSHPDFREFGISVITLMRMFLGDFEYHLIEEANHILGPIYFLTYVLFVFFILLNMFLAIINDTYGAVKIEVSKGHSYFGSYLEKSFRRIFAFCFQKKKITIKADDTIMLTETSHKQAQDNEDIAGNTTTTRGINQKPSSDRVRITDSEVLREYFEELPGSQQSVPTPEIPKDNNDLKRLNKRITLLEDVLEQLITNMDRILRKVEARNPK